MGHTIVDIGRVPGFICIIFFNVVLCTLSSARKRIISIQRVRSTKFPELEACHQSSMEILNRSKRATLIFAGEKKSIGSASIEPAVTRSRGKSVTIGLPKLAKWNGGRKDMTLRKAPDYHYCFIHHFLEHVKCWNLKGTTLSRVGFFFLTPSGYYSLEKMHEANLDKYYRYGKIFKEEFQWGVPFVHVYDPVDIETVLRHQGKYPLRLINAAAVKFRKEYPEIYGTVGIVNA